jgi:hypothetical protein
MALHNPEKVRPENRDILSMKKEDMRDFAETKGLKNYKKGKGLGKYRGRKRGPKMD